MRADWAESSNAVCPTTLALPASSLCVALSRIPASASYFGNTQNHLCYRCRIHNFFPHPVLYPDMQLEKSVSRRGCHSHICQRPLFVTTFWSGFRTVLDKTTRPGKEFTAFVLRVSRLASRAYYQTQPRVPHVTSIKPGARWTGRLLSWIGLASSLPCVRMWIEDQDALGSLRFS